MATKRPTNPKNLLQQILADADTYNLGTKEFRLANEQLYKEHTNRYGFTSRQDWINKTLPFLDGHEYFTNYCKEKLQDRKKKNTTKLQKEWKQINDVKPVAETEITSTQSKANTNQNEIQIILNNTTANNTKQNEITDHKANILIAVNGLIIPVILTVLLSKSVAATYLTIPMLILLLSSVCTIIIAILAVRPKATKGVFSDQDIADKKANLLSFGNFHKMPFENYESAIKVLLEDQDYLHSSLIKDIHQSGILLARKHRLLRWAYHVFMLGIVLSVIAFSIVMLINSGICHVNI